MKEFIGGGTGHLSLIALERTSGLGCPGWKRFLDVIVALMIMPFVLPIMLLAILYIRFVSKGPILFRQQRVGYLGRPFTLLKFRTMHAGADPRLHKEHIQRLIAHNLPLTKLDAQGDKRLIPGGAVIRALCLDELPQLFNVLFGDMSLVGPRPCMEYEYAQLLPWQMKRFNSPPGMTGLWQVKRGPQTNFFEMMQMDLEYVCNRTVWLDLGILLETAPAVLSQVVRSRRVKQQSISQPVLVK